MRVPLLARMPRAWIHLAAVIGAALALVVAYVTVTVSAASAATLFSDDFEDGNSTGWTTSGGSWSVATDGSRVFRQSGTSSDARARAGTSSWTDYTVTARVKPTAFNGSNRFVAVLARAQSNTSYYYLALRSNNTVELKKLVERLVHDARHARRSRSPLGTWYTLRLEVSGHALRGTVNGGAAAERHRQPVRAPARSAWRRSTPPRNFDDVVVEHRSAARTDRHRRSIAAVRRRPSTPARCDPGPNVADGWASVNAWGQNGTTGGAGGPTVTVTTAAQFLSEIAASGPRVIRVSGMIDAARPDARRHVRQDDRRRRARTPASPAAA